MGDDLQRALEKLQKAVTDEGPRPIHHRRVAAETRRRWPSLMVAVYEVLNALEGEKS